MEYNRTCNFYLDHKKRNCNMLVKIGQQYCGQHLVAEHSTEAATQYKRIPCPLDPKHSCFQHRLEHHVAVCNARSRGSVGYIQHDCNLRVPVTTDVPKVTVASLSDAKLLSFLARVEAAHSELVGPIVLSVLHHDVVEAMATEAGNSVPGGIRHLAQNSSLVGHLRDTQLLDTSEANTCYVEFGAGRGQMTHYLTRSVTQPALATFLLVDRGAQRYKCDAKMKYNGELSVNRLRVDIKDLHLPGVPDLEQCGRLVAVGKHLCGGATDVALQCVSQYHTSGSAEVAGVVLALCCHHRCSWPSYVATHFLQEAGFSPEEFYTLTSLTSWATCSPKSGKEKVDKQDEEENGVQESDGEIQEKDIEEKKPNNRKCGEKREKEQDKLHTPLLKINDTSEKKATENRYVRLGLSAMQREDAGRLAKQLLDEGRARFLQTQGFTVQLIQYVERETTPENVALLAWRETVKH